MLTFSEWYADSSLGRPSERQCMAAVTETVHNSFSKYFNAFRNCEICYQNSRMKCVVATINDFCEDRLFGRAAKLHSDFIND